MDPVPRQKLALLLERFGTDVGEDPRKLKALLLDECPAQRLEVALLVAAAEEGVARRLSRASGRPPAAEIDRLARLLEASRGLSPASARWAVGAWASALGVAPPPADEGAQAEAAMSGGEGDTDAGAGTDRARPRGPGDARATPPPDHVTTPFRETARPGTGRDREPEPRDRRERPLTNRSSPVAVGLGVGAAAAVAVVVAALALAGGDPASGPIEPVATVTPLPSDAATPSPTVTATPSPTQAPPPSPAAPPPAPAAVGEVLAQPAGLFCRDLAARGYSYSAAVDYWRHHGQPDRMDADLNGIPCETVYPRASVVGYYRETPAGAVGSGLPGGLLCRDLADRGVDYAGAVAYWFWEGAPDRMDVDLNGIPCETVYPVSAVQSYWG